MTITLPDPISAPVVETTTTAPVEEIPAIDPALLAAMTAIAKAALTEAVAATPVPTMRPGTVQGVNSTDRTVSVLLDGDDVAITVQSLIELPQLYDRVQVLFMPPSAAFLIGNITAVGVPPGTLAPYGGTISNHAGATVGSATTGYPPRGWLWCAGQAVSRSTYSALFAAIGTTWGSGDGATTFNVPDYRGRVFLGLDNMGGSDAGRIAASNTLAGTGGITTVIAHTHSIDHDHGSTTTGSDGSHTHDLGNHTHTIDPPTNGTLYGGPFDPGSGGTGNTINNTGSTTTSGPSTNTSGSGGSHTHSVDLPNHTGTSGSTGTGTEQLPPYALCHIIIKA